MKSITHTHHLTQILTLLLIVSLLFSCLPAASAASAEEDVTPYASQYITSYRAWLSVSSGQLVVNFSITTNGSMTSLGATRISIYESDGTHVRTYYSTTTSGMMASNRLYYVGSVSCDNYSPSTSYYAKVYFKAANSSGSDTATYTTYL